MFFNKTLLITAILVIKFLHPSSLSALDKEQSKIARSFFGCYELTFTFPNDEDPLYPWTPPRRIRLGTGKPPKNFEGRCRYLPSEGELIVQAEPGQKINQCVFEFSSWRLHRKNEIILTWTTGEVGVEMILKREPNRLHGVIHGISDYEISNGREVEHSKTEYEVIANPIKCSPSYSEGRPTSR